MAARAKTAAKKKTKAAPRAAAAAKPRAAKARQGVAPRPTRASAPGDAPKRAISDAAVRDATGRPSDEWFALLDAFAKRLDGHQHQAAADYLHKAHGCPPWWSQMVTVLYERERGLRQRHERPDGYSISVSRTLPVPVQNLYSAWQGKRPWLAASGLKVRKATVDRSMRITWTDGTSVEVMFYAKGHAKSQVTVQHSKHKAMEAAEMARAFWASSLDALSAALI